MSNEEKESIFDIWIQEGEDMSNGRPWSGPEPVSMFSGLTMMNLVVIVLIIGGGMMCFIQIAPLLIGQ